MSEPDSQAPALDRRALARSFNRAAHDYDAAATLQHQARSELLQRLPFFGLDPQCVIDLGAGTCLATPALARAYPRANVLAIDLAAHMLARAPRPLWRRPRFERICADAFALPLAAHCCDLIFSNLMLQWCDPLERLFTELGRVLRPGGVLLFSSFGPGTLHELRGAWASVDARPHVHEFADMPEICTALMRAGFLEPVVDLERRVDHYPSAQALMRAIKRIGAQNAASARARGLAGRARLQAVCAAYEPCREPAGLPATWELLFGAAFAGEPRPTGPHAPPDEHAVPIDRIGRRALATRSDASLS